MKIVFFGYDYSIPVLRRVLDDGHEVMAIVTFENDHGAPTHLVICEAAKQLGVPLHIGKISAEQMDTYVEQGAELFLSAGFRYKIPVVDESKAYAINVHPTLLPQGRGLMPMPKLFLEHPDSSGITVHKLSEGFDEGDILLQEALPISPQDDIATLSARFALKSPDLVSEVLSNIEHYWNNATPQGDAGSWWEPPVHEDRIFDWSKDVAATARMIQAFGRFGMIAEFDGYRWVVLDASAWEDSHDYKPGSVVLRLSNESVIALSDGYVMLKQFQMLDQ